MRTFLSTEPDNQQLANRDRKDLLGFVTKPTSGFYLHLFFMGYLVEVSRDGFAGLLNAYI